MREKQVIQLVFYCFFFNFSTTWLSHFRWLKNSKICNWKSDSISYLGFGIRHKYTTAIFIYKAHINFGRQNPNMQFLWFCTSICYKNGPDAKNSFSMHVLYVCGSGTEFNNILNLWNDKWNMLRGGMKHFNDGKNLMWIYLGMIL